MKALNKILLIPAVLMFFILTSAVNLQNKVILPEGPETDAFQTRIFTGFGAGDRFGSSTKTAGDVNGDGYDDFIIGGFLNDAAGIDAGRAYIYFGGTSIDTIPDIILSGESAGNAFGGSVSNAGDVNGDGFSDVIVSATYYQNNTGRVYIYYGGKEMDSTPDVILNAETPGGWFGISVSDAGDVNRDGFSDVIVGAFYFGNKKGRAYIYFGGSSMNSIADVTMTGEGDYYEFGGCVSGAGDVNGDGFSDVLVGANQYDLYAPGKAYIFLGGTNMNNIPDVEMVGGDYGDQFGRTLSGAGDVNGDGFTDVIIGMNGFNNGRDFAYVYFGNTVMDNVADVILSEPGNLIFGFNVSGAGDINGDGFSDVMVNAWIYNNVSKVYIYYGGPDINNVFDIVLEGEGPNDRFGTALSSAGDVNSDGYSDLVIGAVEYNSYTGKAFLYMFGINGTINISVIPEGYYNSTTGILNFADTVKAFLHANTSPFAVIDSASAVIDPASFTGSFKFFNAPDGIYYIVIKHRNSLETWSKTGGEEFLSGTNMNYDFISLSSQACGNNLKQIDSSPVRFGVYSGDVNKNGHIDLVDVLYVYIDALSFNSGYIITDINGNGSTDLSDLLTTYNNSINSMYVVKP